MGTCHSNKNKINEEQKHLLKLPQSSCDNINVYHPWNIKQSNALFESLYRSDIHIPNDVICMIELFLSAEQFEIRIPYFPYPQYLFNKIKKEYFYYQIRLGFIGDKNVGISSIILQSFRNLMINSNHISPLIGYNKSDIFFAKKTNVMHNNKTYECQLSIYKDYEMIFGERAVQNTLNWNNINSINIDIYLLVVDLLKKDSFLWIIQQMNKIQRIKNYRSKKDYCIILVGNKCDQLTKMDANSYNMVMELKNKMNAFCMKYSCPYIECSANENTHIEELFDIAVKEAIMHKGESIHT